MQWVHTNADKLHLDPKRITVSGQSAGAMSLVRSVMPSDTNVEVGFSSYVSQLKQAVYWRHHAIKCGWLSLQRPRGRIEIRKIVHGQVEMQRPGLHASEELH